MTSALQWRRTGSSETDPPPFPPKKNSWESEKRKMRNIRQKQPKLLKRMEELSTSLT